MYCSWLITRGSRKLNCWKEIQEFISGSSCPTPQGICHAFYLVNTFAVIIFFVDEGRVGTYRAEAKCGKRDERDLGVKEASNSYSTEEKPEPCCE